MNEIFIFILICIIIIVIIVVLILILLQRENNISVTEKTKKSLTEIQSLYENKNYPLFEKKANVFKNTNREVNYYLANMYFQAKNTKRGRKAWNRYILLGGTKSFSRDHLKFFIAPLIRMNKYEIKPDSYKEKFYNSSPCLLFKKSTNEWLYNIRYINYYPSNEFGNYIRDHPNNEAHTHNVLCYIDSESKKIKKYDKIKIAQDIRDKYFINKTIEAKSLEDMRVFALQDDNTALFFATCLETNMAGIPQICYGKIKLNQEFPIIDELYPLKVQKDASIWEKNLLPYVVDDKINFVYQWDPFTIGIIDMNPKEDFQVNNIDIKYYEPNLIYPKQLRNYSLENFRGSSPPIKYKNGYLCIVHSVIDTCEKNRVYYHRLVWFTKKELRIGDPFYFNNVAIEFNLSISILDGICYITNSDNDATSMINEVNLDTINEYLDF